MKPTDKQKQEFWELCGLTYTEDDTTFTEWRTASGELVCCGHTNKCLPIDLNNLFKYAVPKLDKLTLEWDSFAKDMWWARADGEYDAISKDPADGLFWAIYKALGGKV